MGCFLPGTARLRFSGRYRGGSDPKCEGSSRSLVRAIGGFGSSWREDRGSGAYVSERFPVRNSREVIRILRKHGFAMIGQRGSHQKWRHASGRQVIVAMHGNKPIPIGTLKSIIEGSGLTMDDFR
jgi:predicted RNA binding protein YcfA (HicA-like mRNA interferase family)